MAGMRYQPQGLARVDWSNPITRGLAFAYVHLGFNIQGFGPSIPSAAFGYTVTRTPRGLAAQTRDTNTTLYQTPQTNVTGANYSLLAVGSATSTSAVQAAIDDDNDTSSPRCFQFRVNGGKTELITFDTGGGPYFATAPAMTAAQLASGFVMGAQVAGNNIAVFQNGQKTSGTASGTQRTPTGSFLIGQHKGTFGNGWATGGLALVAAWSRTLSDAEMRSLSDNPWQLFVDPDDVYDNYATPATGSSVAPGTAALALTGYAPSVAQSANRSASPAVGSLAITGYAPSVSQPIAIAPGAGSLALTGFAPGVSRTANQGVAPGAGGVVLTGFTPSVTQSAITNVAPQACALGLAGYAPSIAQTQNISISPAAAALAITGFAPSVARTANLARQPSAGGLVLTGYGPVVSQAKLSPYPPVYQVTILSESMAYASTQLVDAQAAASSLAASLALATIMAESRVDANAGPPSTDIYLSASFV